MDAFPLYPSRVDRLLYFTIYHEVTDHAFQIAAETWAPIMMKDIGFNAKRDRLMMLKVSAESDFKSRWSEIAKCCQNEAALVVEGHIFSHASNPLDPKRGLEFRTSPTDDGTLEIAEIAKLEPLNWHPSFGKLTLEGCNTGLKDSLGRCPAEAFAKRQRVTTEGQTGYAVFSRVLDRWEKVNATETQVLDDKIYLWAYNRGKNNLIGDGARMPGALWTP